MIYINPEWKKIFGDYEGKKYYEYFYNIEEPPPDCRVKKALETRTTIVTPIILIVAIAPPGTTILTFVVRTKAHLMLVWLLGPCLVVKGTMEKGIQSMGVCTPTAAPLRVKLTPFVSN